MKDALFFTPNRGLKSAAEFILAALNGGGPPRFKSVDFVLIHENKEERIRKYETSFKAGHVSLLAIERVMLCTEEVPSYFLRTTLRTQSLRGSIQSHSFTAIRGPEERFPTVNDAWQEKLRVEFGSHRTQDVWDRLLDVEKIRRMPF